MTIKAMIFDLDGTLLDTLADLTRSMNVALTSVGLPPRTAEECRLMIGNALPAFSRRAVGPDNQHLAQAVAARMRDEYRANCTNETAIYEGLAPALDELKKRGIRLAVLTNKDQDVARQIVEHYFGTDTFDPIAGTKPDTPIKPDPTSTLAILKQWNLPPAEVLFVGDSDTDVQTAHNANLRAVGVSWGFRGRQHLEAANADTVIDHPQELLALC
ncbi:MAG TPA: HAD family hydrolase [Anaerohalosphaeraceae bacterium]|jgi:phosphoglycolate phosphatase|nr:HAD family hydrolase [Anaerohalosphaeraceae bacterium]HRT51268.1 HAD family hydrolase [Anaerohalosphaeraceae bacterium]HRT87765.1 HAD family hydrolase [Anaerohalosphaeraceae bacterium]